MFLMRCLYFSSSTQLTVLVLQCSGNVRIYFQVPNTKIAKHIILFVQVLSPFCNLVLSPAVLSFFVLLIGVFCLYLFQLAAVL